MERTNKNETVIRKTTVILTLYVSSFVTKCLSLVRFTGKISSLESRTYFGTRRRLIPPPHENMML